MVKQVVISNKKAYYDYSITEEIECGMVLEGWEVKAIANNNCSIAGTHCRIFEGEAFLMGASIGTAENDLNRTRKLLLHKKELNKLIGKAQEKRLTLVPLKIYNKHGKFKLLVGLAKGKTSYDKREYEKNRDIDNEARKIVKSQKYDT